MCVYRARSMLNLQIGDRYPVASHIMQRRTFIIGIGAATASGAGLIGTGAFSSVTAERGVTVSVVGDADAFLALEPLDPHTDNYVAFNSDDIIEFDFAGGDGDDETFDQFGEGLNPNAFTSFEDAFSITNNGTQDVGVKITAPESLTNEGVKLPAYANEGDVDGEREDYNGSIGDLGAEEAWTDLATGDTMYVSIVFTESFDVAQDFELAFDITASADEHSEAEQ